MSQAVVGNFVVAPQVDVLLETGKSVPLASLYAERPLVLVFLRHFGCPFCREQVAQLRMAKDLNIAFVGMGEPRQAQSFKGKLASPHPYICDPERQLYTAFNLGRGKAGQVVGPKMFLRGFGAVLRGQWVGLPIGDPWQMPGIFLIETDGRVSWEYRSTNASDNLSLGRIQQSFGKRQDES